MKGLTSRAAFLHVIDDHRWLSASGCLWNLLAATTGDGVRAEANALLPNVDVIVQDSVLLHARSLIEFYSKSHSSGTDILLCDFGGLTIESSLKAKLVSHRRPVEVHLLHLTAWRDRDFRVRHAKGNDANTARPDWNKKVKPLVELILNALKRVSEKARSGNYLSQNCIAHAIGDIKKKHSSGQPIYPKRLTSNDSSRTLGYRTSMTLDRGHGFAVSK